MSFSIAGKTAIVTGAANGLGLAIARHLVDQGARVVLADRDEARLKAEIAKINGAEENAIFVAGDLRERLTLANLISATVDAFDRVDVLVNATRQCQICDPLDDQSDAVEVALQQNLLASLKLSQMVAKRMIAQAEGQDVGKDRPQIGAIINLSSIAAQRTQPSLMAYSIASAAMDQMTRALAVALAEARIRVNGISVGSVMSANLKEQLQTNDEYRGRILAQTPMGRIGAATEAAEAVQFLASDAAAFMTGQILTIDGGRTLLDPAGVPAH
jgi:7-alpha-hydroxysteroid dehydrogenase